MFISRKEHERLKENHDTGLEASRQVKSLREKIRTLKDDLAELKTTKKMETREIEHLVKIKEEKLELEHQRKEVELTSNFNSKHMDLQKDYHDKVVEQIEGFNKRQDKFFEQVMKRLPKVNVELNNNNNRGKEE